MGSSREVAIAALVEPALLLALAGAALAAGLDRPRRDRAGGVRGGRGLVHAGAPPRRPARSRSSRSPRRATSRRQPRHAPRADDDPRGDAARGVRPAAGDPHVRGRAQARPRRRRCSRPCSCRSAWRRTSTPAVARGRRSSRPARQARSRPRSRWRSSTRPSPSCGSSRCPGSSRRASIARADRARDAPAGCRHDARPAAAAASSSTPAPRRSSLLGVLIAATRSIGRSIWLVGAPVDARRAGGARPSGSPPARATSCSAALLAIGVKGIVVPLVLGLDPAPIVGPPGAPPARSARALSLVAAVAIVFAASCRRGRRRRSAAAVAAGRALPAAIAEVLTGLLIVMTRRKALSLVVGLLVFENGIALTAFSLTYGMPLVVELGVALRPAHRGRRRLGLRAADARRLRQHLDRRAAEPARMTELARAPRRRRARRGRRRLPGSRHARRAARLALRGPRRRRSWRALVARGPGLRRTVRCARSAASSSIDALGAYVLVLVARRRGHLRSRARRRYLAHERPRARCGRTTRAATTRCSLWFVAGLAAVPLARQPRARVGRRSRRRRSSRRCWSASRRTPAGDRGGLEVPHPRLDRDRLRAARRRCSSTPRRSACSARRSDALAWTRLVAIAPRLDPAFVRLAFVFALVGLRHEGRPRAVPHLAARRPQPGAEPDLRAALGRRPRRVALRAGPVPPGRGRDARAGVLVDAAGRLRPAQPRRRAAVHRRPGRPQAAARLLLDRAPGPGHARPRLRRPPGAARVRAPPRAATASPSRPRSSRPGGSSRSGAAAGSGGSAGSLARSPADGRALVVGALLLAGLPPSGIFVGGARDPVRRASRAGWGLAAAVAALLLALAVAGLAVPRRAGRGRAGGSAAGRRPGRALAAAPAATRPRRTWALLLAVPLGGRRRSRACGRPSPLADARSTRSSRSWEAARG